jgi:hypothetical protein
MKSFLLILMIGAILSFSACGGGGTGTIHTNTTTYTISASVTGLASGTSLVLQDNAGGQLTFSSNTTQAFSNSYTSGASYAVTVATQPSNQTCALGSNASGTATANVTVAVTCTTNTTTNFTISIAVTGLSSGTLVLQDNVGDQLSFTSNATQAFATSYASGASYAVTLSQQPAGQLCTPSGATSGTITANITIPVACSAVAVTYNVSVTVSGLAAGASLTVGDNQSDSLSFGTNTTQTFAKSYASGATYSVTVTTQPAGETCTLSSNASGTITANVTVTATCTPNTANYSLSVAATGLATGATLVVSDSQLDVLTFTTNTTQTFAKTYTSGSAYSVTITTQPTGKTCTLGSNASGTITANTTVTATCTTNTTNDTLSVAVTGLSSGATLVVGDSQGDSLTFTSNTTQPFAKTYTSGSTYSVTITTQPSGETCTLGSNASGTITANTTVTATCTTSSGNPTLSVSVTGLSGSVSLQDDQGDTLTFSSGSGVQTFAKSYTSGSTYTVYVTSQPAAQACTPTYSLATISSNVTLSVACATGTTRALGTVSNVSSISCSGSPIPNPVCQQMTVSCPSVPNVQAYIQTNTPTGTSLGTVTYNVGTDGNGLYENIYKQGTLAVQTVLNAGFTTVQISWGTPFTNGQPAGWVGGPGGVLASACRYATLTQWISTNINAKGLPLCATANSGGAGALAYALSQYPTSDIISMAEVTSGPPTGRLDWGCGCQQGKLAVQCGSSSTLGTCFGPADAPVWDPAYNPNSPTNAGLCSTAVNGTLPPGGLNFFLGDSVEAPGATYNMPKTNVNLVFGSADGSSAIPIAQDWFDNITSTKGQVCVANGTHSMADTVAGATQIANDLINLCKVQP